MRLLRNILIALVVLLAAAVVYGYASTGDGDDESGGDRVPFQVQNGRGSGADAEARPGAVPRVPPRPSREAPKPAAAEARERPAEKPPERTAQPPDRSVAASSRAAYIERADAICQEIPRKLRERVERISRGSGGQAQAPVDVPQLSREAAAPVLSEAARDMGALEPPAGDEARTRAVVAALDGAARAFAAAQGATPTEALRALVEFQRLAREYGLRACRALS